MIEDGRKNYTERTAINDLLDKQQRKDVRRQRDQELRTILPDGREQGWKIQITQVLRQNSMSPLTLKLPCGPAFLVVTNTSQNPDLLSQALKVPKGQYVQVFGTLNPSPSDVFQESSATESDSM